jgi:1,4-alpha-glucan branching enzyme
MHKGMQSYVRDLNKLYTKYDAMYFNDNEVMGFEWTKVDDADSGIVAFVRRGKTAKDQIMFICNFVPVERKDYKLGVPCNTTYKEILSSDDEKYGGLGRNMGPKKAIKASPEPCDRMKNSIVIDVPPLSVTVLKYDYKD